MRLSTSLQSPVSSMWVARAPSLLSQADTFTLFGILTTDFCETSRRMCCLLQSPYCISCSWLLNFGCVRLCSMHVVGCLDSRFKGVTVVVRLHHFDLWTSSVLEFGRVCSLLEHQPTDTARCHCLPQVFGCTARRGWVSPNGLCEDRRNAERGRDREQED